MPENINETTKAVSDITAAALGYAAKAVGKANDGQSGELAGRAYRAIKDASITINQTLGNAERAATDQRVYPAGRAAGVADMAKEMNQKTDDAVGDAEVAVRVVEASSLIGSRPVRKGSQEAADNGLARVLDATPPERLHETLMGLVRKGGDLGAAVYGEVGRALLEARGVDSVMYSALDQAAIEGALSSGDAERKAHAEQYRNLAGLKQAVDGMRAAAHTAEQRLAELHTVAADSPEQREITRLRRLLAERRGGAM